MRKSMTLITAAAAVLLLAAQLFAGGFWVVLGNPDASPEAKAMHAVLTIKAVGCHDPVNAQIAAAALGMVDGKRQTIPLKLAKLPVPGMYALTRQWPAEGRWIIQIVGHNGAMTTSTLVAAGPDGIDRNSAKFAAGEPAPNDVDALLVARK